MSDILNNPEQYFNKLSDEEFFSLLDEFDIEFKILEVGTNKGDSNSKACRTLQKCVDKLKETN